MARRERLSRLTNEHSAASLGYEGGVTKSFQGNVWILIERAGDLPGVWIAHCLDFDVVTQGRSLRHAFAMAQEAVEMTMSADLKADRDPRERRAPSKRWAHLWDVVERAERRPPKGPLIPTDESYVGAFAAEMALEAGKRRRKGAQRPMVPVALALSSGAPQRDPDGTPARLRDIARHARGRGA
jgi:predicted RNase H-like HicB family nuclease